MKGSDNGGFAKLFSVETKYLNLFVEAGKGWHCLDLTVPDNVGGSFPVLRRGKSGYLGLEF